MAEIKMISFGLSVRIYEDLPAVCGKVTWASGTLL
jgi:hypothetical protein